jgi:hypothetical protein
LSVTTGSDVFGPTNVNSMIIDQGEMTEVSISSSGEGAKTNMTCLVHPTSQVMLPSHFSNGVCGSSPKWSIPIPMNPTLHNVKVLRADTGCTAGPNILHLSPSS